MRKHPIIALLICALAVCVLSAQPAFCAQPGRTDGQSVKAKASKAALNLTADQKARIKDVVVDSRKQIEAIKNDASLSADDKKARIAAIHRAKHAKIWRILTPKQREVWAKHHRARALVRLARFLDLTADQKTQIASILKSQKTELQTVRRDTSLSKEAKAARIKAIRKATAAGVREVLTIEQQRKFDDARAKRLKKRG